MKIFGLVISLISIVCWSILFVDSYMLLQNSLLTLVSVTGLGLSCYLLILSMEDEDGDK